jgi:hypothetical protein
MSNVAVVTIAWGGFVAHLVAAILARRRLVELPVVPLVNLVTSSLVLAYWAQRWYGYVFQGISWSATDQLLPLYASIVCVLAAVAMWGRSGGTLQWVFLLIDGIALLGAAMLFSVLRFDRMF